MSVHPSGNHVLIGSVEGQLVWFDLDLSSRPYKRIRDHTYTVSSIAFHPTLPLFADASDDQTVAVFHATVYEDLLQNPLIVPLKVLKLPHNSKGTGVWSICWHPQLPWLFVSGIDEYVRLYADTS
ncbi:Ribosome biogenesis protein bop1-A [Galdieria sulphuraria]|nr:Ribosome biogenesis protein bop1-A [Galdieria sulphuraria]